MRGVIKLDNDYFKKYLEERYKDQIAWYDKKATFNQKVFKWLQWLIIISSALTPIFILANILAKIEFLKWVAVAIASLIAISTSAQKAFKYQENWINYRATCETLKKELYYYNCNLQGYDNTKDKEALFIDRVESLISRENTYWVTTKRE